MYIFLNIITNQHLKFLNLSIWCLIYFAHKTNYIPNIFYFWIKNITNKIMSTNLQLSKRNRRQKIKLIKLNSRPVNISCEPILKKK